MIDQEGLRKEFEQKKRDAAQLRSQLFTIHKEKEEAFQKLKSSRDAIYSKTKAMQLLKKERDDLTKEVKGLKEERQKLNQEVKDKSGLLKEVEQKKGELAKDLPEYNSSGRLKAMIRKLEETLETEVMSFDKEKKMYKQIKDLKVEYKQVAGLEQVWKERNTVAADFSHSRKQAQFSHQAVQQKAQEAQQKHEALNALYEEVKKIRSDVKPLEDEHQKLRAKYQETKKQLDEYQKRITELSHHFHEKEEKTQKSKVHERTEEVKEKIRTRQKLNIDDILAFQALDEKD